MCLPARYHTSSHYVYILKSATDSNRPLTFVCTSVHSCLHLAVFSEPQTRSRESSTPGCVGGGNPAASHLLTLCGDTKTDSLRPRAFVTWVFMLCRYFTYLLLAKEDMMMVCNSLRCRPYLKWSKNTCTKHLHILLSIK